MQPTRKILSPELQAKIEKRVRECLAIAQRAYPAHADKFEEAPTVRYNIKNAFSGVAISGGQDDYTIRLNLILCFENEAHFIEHTVGHEVAHLVQRRVYGHTKIVDGKVKKVMSHGPEWREVMGHLGLKPARTHKYDVSSLDIKKKKRAKRGAVVTAQGLEDMLRRLQNGFKRLPDQGKELFMQWMETESAEGEQA